MIILDPAWEAAEKKTDPDFEGSLEQKVGFDNLLCPTCGAHLKDGICLNACHLSKASRDRFNALMKAIGELE